MEFLDALRDAKSQLMAGGKNTLLNKVLTVQTENKLNEVKRKLLELKQLIDDDKVVFTSIGTEIEKFLKKVSIEEGVSQNKIIFDFPGVEASEILKKISLIYGTTPINIERNGLGRNNLLYISLLLSQLMQQVEKEDKKVFFRLIGIEEPEAHLHPHLQVHLSRNIESEISDERQILITSHSTHITSQLSLDETIVLYRDKGKIKPYYLFKNIPKPSKNYLYRYLDATKSTMFFARKIIMVEGISEQLLIPEFFKMKNNGVSIEQKGITLINVNGVAFSHFLEVIKTGYFLKSIVFTDSDSTKQTSERAIDLQKTYNSDIIQIKCTKLETFEKDLIACNKSGESKDLLFQGLILTKSKNGPRLQTKTSNNDIITDEFFTEIEKYKAEFAMNLLDVLKDDKNKDKRRNFNVPKYIEDGFTHIVS